ncbi:MAG: hypothetical protein WAZ48_13805 [Lysobacteraceae bacterium]
MISKYGAFFSVAFFLYAMYFVVLKMNGAWQAPIFIYMATLPFSIFTNQLADYLQEAQGWTNDFRSNAECSMAIILGIFEFYVIGFLFGKLMSPAKRDPQ